MTPTPQLKTSGDAGIGSPTNPTALNLHSKIALVIGYSLMPNKLLNLSKFFTTSSKSNTNNNITKKPNKLPNSYNMSATKCNIPFLPPQFPLHLLHQYPPFPPYPNNHGLLTPTVTPKICLKALAFTLTPNKPLQLPNFALALSLGQYTHPLIPQPHLHLTHTHYLNLQT